MPGIKGQKWGVRRFQNEDGTLTEEGKRRYGYTDAHTGGEGLVSKQKTSRSPYGKSDGPDRRKSPDQRIQDQHDRTMRNAKNEIKDLVFSKNKDKSQNEKKPSIRERMKKHQEEDAAKKTPFLHKKVQNESAKSLAASGVLAIGFAALSNKLINKYDTHKLFTSAKYMNYATMAIGGAELIAAGNKFIGDRKKKK